MPVKILMIPITGPGDVLKLQDILEQALKGDGVKETVIPCSCDGAQCNKVLSLSHLQDGRTVLKITRGADLLMGITLDEEGKARLVQELGGRMVD